MKSSIDLSQYDKKGYYPGRNFVVRGLWYVVNMVFFTCPLVTSYGIKRTLLRWFGARIGQQVVIKPRVNIKYPWLLEIGDNSWIGEQVWVDNLAKVKIGSNVCISQGALLECGNHDYRVATFDLLTDEITMEDGSWIGAKAILLAPCHVEEGAVLLSGSVATKRLEAWSIYQGNPATKKKERKIK